MSKAMIENDIRKGVRKALNLMFGWPLERLTDETEIPEMSSQQLYELRVRIQMELSGLRKLELSGNSRTIRELEHEVEIHVR